MESLDLDASQLRAVDGALQSRSTIVLGGAGTGKTTTLLEIASRIIDRGESLVVLGAGRKAADQLRTNLTLRHGKLPANIQIRTAQAWAFSLLQVYAAARGRHTPELITGPTQDSIITELLREASEMIDWPAELDHEIMDLPGFRAELRDLFTRSAELGISGTELIELGREENEQIWIAAGQLMDQYEGALALEDATVQGGVGADRFDHARLVHQAARLLANPEAWQPGEVPTVDWILIDDYQNATLATAALLSAAHHVKPGDGMGARLVMTADPDTAVEGFRGGIAHLPGLARGTKPGIGLSAGVVTLDHRYRAGAELAELHNRIVDRIGVAGFGTHRRPEPGSSDDTLTVRTFPGTDQEQAGIARMIRRAHVRNSVPYDDMAIITRSRNVHTELERVLRDAGVRVRPAARNEPLRYVPIVRALMNVMREGVAGDLTETELYWLLSSPLIGLDPSKKRQLTHRVSVWGHENETGQPLRVLMGETEADWATPLRKLHRILEATRTAVAEGKNAEEVLWAAWQAADLAENLREQALAGGATSGAANAMLDAVMHLFRIAQRLVDRDARTTSAQFLDELESQEIVEDSIARTGQESGVHLLTPAMAIGQEFTLVIVADLNDGTWPNLRVRDGLFGAGKLAELYLDRLTDNVTSLRSVVDDELRMLAFAASRATHHLVLTAVDSEETSRSRFIDLLIDEDNVEHVQVSKLSMSIPGVVGRLRSALTDPTLTISETDRELAADMLVSLPSWTAEHLPGVAPRDWIPSLPPSDPRPWSRTTRISPSGIADISKCTLKWFVQRIGLSDTENRQALDRGNLIHDIAEAHPDGDAAAIMASFEKKWPEYSIAFTEGYERDFEKKEILKTINTLIFYLNGQTRAQVEQKLSVETPHFTVSGRIDRIEETTNGPIITDFKTGTTAETKAEAEENPQLRTYQWLYEQVNGSPSAGAQLVYVRLPQAKGNPTLREQKALDDSGREAVVDMLNDVASQLGGIDIAARKGTWCDHCPVKNMCPNFDEGALFS